ncbi:uncharacterized protein J3R85_014168 [Psidium guajava]|nr:uncharacterized protein J3R85_014168 [Psidium guajava]
MGRYCSQILALVTLLLILDDSGVCFGRNSTSICREREREALLQLRQSYGNPSRLLSSWKGQDCCKWEGVTCDRVYGHVIELRLPSSIEDKNASSLASQLNSSLLHLKYSNHLDLSGISFDHGRIPEFLGPMKQLRYLNLSYTNFHGTIPRQLGNLTKLEVLDIQENENLVVDDTLWISHLRSLKYLDMSGLIIANGRVLMQAISTLPSLSHLSLSYCELQNFHLPSLLLANSTSLVHLRYLDLSSNIFQGPIPSTPFQNMTSLQHLDLSSNSFNSSIPMWFDKFTSIAHLNLEANQFDSIEGGLFSFIKNKRYLKSLRLCYNQIGEESSTTPRNSSGLIENSLESLEICVNDLKGALPNWLVHFTNLKTILLSFNSFSSSIPSVIGSFSNLVALDLSSNGLNGTIPSSLGRLSSLKSLDLSNNQLVGPIPESLGELRALQLLFLYSNRLNSTIPNSFGKLSQLSVLDLSENSLGGVISEIHFSNLSRLRDLDVSGNSNLTFRTEPSWIPPFQLRSIQLRSCKFGTTTFPQWVRTQMEAEEITLSNASLFGPLPKWLANLTFFALDLSENQITGPLPSLSSSCSTLDLSHNFISGSLPTNIGAMYQLKALYLNDNLINSTIPSSLCDMEGLLDLSLDNNKLSGSIPDCWKGSLSFFTLSFNELSGVIPSSIGTLPKLSTLHLNGNRLNGELPLALGNCTGLVILDLGENNLSGSFPTWFNESFHFLQILRLRENRFTSGIPLQLCSLSRLQILDIAVNNLTGTIPRCLGNLTSMMNFNQVIFNGTVVFTRNWAHEHVVETLKGRHNEYTKVDLQLVVNLDLSSNFLIGSIPEEFSFLAGLHGLNLSHNRLSGDIPTGIGNMRSLESLDFSNNRLSGTIPQGISELTSLAHLNLLQNNFTGQIPKGSQIQTLDDPSIYAGNPLLCGDLLRRKCLAAAPPQAPKVAPLEDMHDKDKLEKALFYGVIMLGFVTGFWGFFGVLQFKKDWRRAYFHFADQATDKAYVAIVVKVAKLKRLRWSRGA